MSNKTAILVASAREDSNTKKVAQHLAIHQQVEVIDILDYTIYPYSYHHDYPSDDSYYTLVEKLLQFDTIIFATPVYWYSMSAQLKIFFDRITDLLKIKKELGRQLRGKSMGLISCSGSDDRNPHFTEPFILSADYLGMEFIGEVHVWVDNQVIEKEALAQLDHFAEKLT